MSEQGDSGQGNSGQGNSGQGNSKRRGGSRGSMFLGSLGGTLTGIGLSGIIDPLLAPALQQLSKQFPSSLFDPTTAALAYQKRTITAEEYIEIFARQGFNTEAALDYFFATRRSLEVDSIISLLRRDVISEQDAYSMAEETGVNAKTFSHLIKALEVQPTPQDLITFLVREVFTPSIYEKFGQHLEFPNDAVKEGAKIGLTKESMEKYWRAHWQLPDVSSVSECMFRFAPDIISEAKDDLDFLGVQPEQVLTDFDTVNTLLKTKDVMPYWRERIRAVQFNNLTRVDVARMIRLKVLNYTKAVYEHRKQGYTPLDSRRLVKFRFIDSSLPTWKKGIVLGTITLDDIMLECKEWNIFDGGKDDTEKTENQNMIAALKREIAPELMEGVSDSRKLGLGKILKAYRDGISTRQETITLAKGLNYSDEQVKFMLEIEESEILERKEREAKQSGLTRTDILRGFRVGKTGKDETITKLEAIGKTKAVATELVEIEELSTKRQAEKVKK